MFCFVNIITGNTVVQIDKAKAVCECLIASKGSDLKLEEAFSLFLLGQVCASFSSQSIILHCFVRYFWYHA